jgi:hypothetical protein
MEFSSFLEKIENLIFFVFFFDIFDALFVVDFFSEIHAQNFLWFFLDSKRFFSVFYFREKFGVIWSFFKKSLWLQMPKISTIFLFSII